MTFTCVTVYTIIEMVTSAGKEFTLQSISFTAKTFIIFANILLLSLSIH